MTFLQFHSFTRSRLFRSFSEISFCVRSRENACFHNFLKIYKKPKLVLNKFVINMAKEGDMSLFNDVLEPFRRVINTDPPKDKLSASAKLNFSDSKEGT